MLDTWVVVVASVAYLGLLFAIAYVGDRRADQRRSIISNGYIYALSLGVYATSWTYYGSVGRAATTGVGFLPIYLGPTVMAALWWVILRKIVRICKQNRITSLADFMSSRYGKSTLLGELVTVIAVVGIVPYIALQLKAISNTFTILRGEPDLATTVAADPPVLADTALYVALLLAAFTIVFGTRHLDATERHEGMVAAIAFESLVKLVAFLAVGIYVTYVSFGGFGDLFGRARTDPDLAHLLTFGETQSYGSWVWLIVLSMLAILLLPRQWQVAVVENVEERHIRTATWLVPLYLLLINVFVLPIAIAGLLTFEEGDVSADAFVLALPMADQQALLTLLVFIGGLSAATGMVIVETIALSTMVSNSLVLPILLRRRSTLADRRDLGRLILAIRRATIVVVLLLGFAYFRLAGESLALVSIGLISFAAVAQFAPAILGGMYWRGATGRGATWGLVAGFAVWAYTLPLPSLSATGWVPDSFVDDGPFGVAILAPHALFGLEGLDEVSHSMLWSMLANVGLFVGLSLTGRRVPAEHVQASLFVDAFTRLGDVADARLWRGRATAGELQVLLGRFLGVDGARAALESYAARTGTDVSPEAEAGADLVHHVESLLAGAVGSASARFIVASVVDEEPLAVSEVLQILDEASQVLAYSRALERKSRQLEAATAELRQANERLQEVDRLKDDFVSTVTHELRTPLTSIRAFSEILMDNPDLDATERGSYLRIVVDETERLTRLINQVLDLSKLESGGVEWQIEPIDLRQVVATSVQATAQIFRDRQVTLEVDLPEPAPFVKADQDRLVQVLLNLLSNAVKFCPRATGRVRISVETRDDVVRVDVRDNGSGIARDDQEAIFEKFRQGGDIRTNRPPGTGLGLPISREIVDHLGGRLWVDSTPGQGAMFSFEIPIAVVGTAPVPAEGDN
ncbi:MAG TPA: sensor histidine kinase [Jiangellaceae bacterium]|nr:sensor histidine kinase [Jiangellaceae bacterium]